MKTLTLKPIETVRLHIPDFKRVSIIQVGAGGTGSHIASGLVAIQAALADRDVMLDVLLIDPDIVEQKNVGRQLFALGDIGKPKAQVIAERLNAAFGCRFGACARAIDALDMFIADDHTGSSLHVVIGAVDNQAARQIIAKAVKQANGKLWVIDSGNESHSGQVFIGNTASANDMKGSISLGMIDRLPSPYLVCPDLLKSTKPKTLRRAPSCAELTAMGEQGLMMNRMMAAWTCSLLSDFLIKRMMGFFGVWVNLETGGVKNYPLDVTTISDLIGVSQDNFKVKVKNGKRH